MRGWTEQRSRAGGRGLALAGVAVLAASGCWPVPGQNADRTAHNPFEDRITVGTVAGLDEAWTAQLDHGAVGSIVVSATRVHPDDDLAVYGLDPATGARSWRTPLTDLPPPGPHPVVAGPSFVADDRVVASLVPLVLGGGGSTTWMDARTGAVERVVDGTGGVDGVRGPLAAATHTVRGTDVTPMTRLVLVDVAGGGVTARPLLHVGWDVPRLTVGEERIYAAGGGVLPPFETLATPAGDVLTFGHAGNGVRALDGGQARPCLPRQSPDPLLAHDCGLWATPLDGTTATAPVVEPGGATVFVGTDAGTVHAVDAGTGAVRWTAAVGAAVEQPPALAGRTLFVPTSSGLVALAAAGCGAPTCPALWSAAAGEPLGVQPAVAGDVVFTGSGSGAIRAFAAGGCGASTCPPLWSADAGAAITAPPVVGSGRLLVGTAAGEVVAYGLPPT